jgi:hypothetical protein
VFDLLRAFDMSLGSTPMGEFARVDVHAGDCVAGTWLLEAHAP